jgi:iron complex transport system permease protein
MRFAPPRAPRPAGLLAALALLVLAVFLLSLAVGPAGFGWRLQGEAAAVIVRAIRLPRAVLAAAVGASLGLGGAALQGYLRNPLAEPSIVGISGGAALGAVLAIQFGAAALTPAGLAAGGLLGAAAAMALIMLLAGAAGGPVTLILAGLAVASLTTALISLALNLAADPFATVEMVYWLLGSLADRSATQVFLSVPLMLVGMAALLGLSRALDALTLGEEAAASLGVDLVRTRLLIVAGTAFSVGAATAVTGVIGFVGLIVPHALRPWVGHRPGPLLWASALGGAAMLLSADVALRLLEPLVELRIGVLTALLGAPFFLYLALKARAEATP